MPHKDKKTEGTKLVDVVVDINDDPDSNSQDEDETDDIDEGYSVCEMIGMDSISFAAVTGLTALGAGFGAGWGAGNGAFLNWMGNPTAFSAATTGAASSFFSTAIGFLSLSEEAKKDLLLKSAPCGWDQLRYMHLKYSIGNALGAGLVAGVTFAATGMVLNVNTGTVVGAAAGVGSALVSILLPGATVGLKNTAAGLGRRLYGFYENRPVPAPVPTYGSDRDLRNNVTINTLIRTLRK